MKKSIILFALIALLVSACSAGAPSQTPTQPEVPQVVQDTATAVPTATSTPTPLPPSATPVPTGTATAVITLFPTVTFSKDTVCRMGPDLNYFRVVNITSGGTSQVEGRSDDSKWLNVLTQAPNKSYTCWVPLESVKAVDNLDALRVVPSAPLPTGASLATVRERPICGVNKAQGAVVVDWLPYADGTGFIVYRNSKELTRVYDHEYIDHDTPASKTPYTLTYTIQAFNAVGLSKVSASVSITLCD